MQTRSSSKLSRDQTSNPTSSTNTTPKGRTRRCYKQKVENSNFEEHLPPVATMADNRTMVEMLRAPTEGCAEAIVVPSILAEQFELKHSLINMMTSEQFFGLEKDNPHDHIRAAHRRLEKEPSHSITTWDDLVSKFINEFFPPSRTTNLRNEISNFHQKFDESFHEAWERYTDLLHACPHHGFTELHQLDTFYNALNPADQDSLNAAAGGNLLEKSPQDALTIIENKSKQTSVMTTAMTTMLKQLQATPPPAPVKAVEEIYVTCRGAHPYYQCLATGGNTFPEFRDNIQAQPNQNFHLNELEKIKRMNDVSMKAMQNQIDMAKNELRNEMKTSIQTSLSNQTNDIKNMMASLLQMNNASTSGSGSLWSNTIANPKGELKAIITRVTDGPTVPTPPKSITPEVDKRVEETYTNPDLTDELKCKALADLGASINLMPLSIWKELGLLKLIPTRMTLELANRAIYTPDGIARDVFVLVGKFTFPAEFVIVDYESDPRVPLILGRPFLRTGRALIDVHGKEMILYDGDERLTLNMKHDTASYSNNPHIESVNLINIFNVSSEDFLESGLKEIEFLLYQGKDSNLKDSIVQMNLANFDDYFVDPTPEMFTDEHAPDYSSPPIFDVYDDDFLEVESDADNVYDDPFDSKGEKIKEFNLLIDELDLPCNFLPYSEYDSFNSQDFSRVDGLPSTDNEDKVFNPGILIHEKSVKIITRVVQDKKLAISNASLAFKDFDPLFYKPLVFKDNPKSKMLLPFSSENKEKVFKLGIYTSGKVHSCFLPELSHPGYHVFKVNQIFISLMKIFLAQCGKNTPLQDVLLFHLYPP
nr:reverse transcriptase domain-containing protein [Tanacetum cinerariifolium]